MPVMRSVHIGLRFHSSVEIHGSSSVFGNMVVKSQISRAILGLFDFKSLARSEPQSFVAWCTKSAVTCSCELFLWNFKIGFSYVMVLGLLLAYHNLLMQ